MCLAQTGMVYDTWVWRLSTGATASVVDNSVANQNLAMDLCLYLYEITIVMISLASIILCETRSCQSKRFHSRFIRYPRHKQLDSTFDESGILT